MTQYVEFPKISPHIASFATIEHNSTYTFKANTGPDIALTFEDKISNRSATPSNRSATPSNRSATPNNRSATTVIVLQPIIKLLQFLLIKHQKVQEKQKMSHVMTHKVQKPLFLSKK